MAKCAFCQQEIEESLTVLEDGKLYHRQCHKFMKESKTKPENGMMLCGGGQLTDSDGKLIFS